MVGGDLLLPLASYELPAQIFARSPAQKAVAKDAARVKKPLSENGGESSLSRAVWVVKSVADVIACIVLASPAARAVTRLAARTESASKLRRSSRPRKRTKF